MIDGDGATAIEFSSSTEIWATIPEGAGMSELRPSTLPPDRSRSPANYRVHNPALSTIRNIVIGSRRTSVRLEAVFWVALHDIAEQQQRTVHQIVTELASHRLESSLASAIRVYVLVYYQARVATGDREAS